MGSARVGLSFPEVKVSRYFPNLLILFLVSETATLSLWECIKTSAWVKRNLLVTNRGYMSFWMFAKVSFKNWMESIREFVMCLSSVMRSLEMFVIEIPSSRTSPCLIVIEDFDISFDFI